MNYMNNFLKNIKMRLSRQCNKEKIVKNKVDKNQKKTMK